MVLQIPYLIYNFFNLYFASYKNMNRRYIREAAVVGLYQNFIELDANIDCFEEQTKENTAITRQILQQHKREFDLSHYRELLPEEKPYIQQAPDEEIKPSEKDFLQQFINSFNTSLQNLQKHLRNLQDQIKTDAVVLIQLIYKLKTIFNLRINDEINQWMDLVNESVINNLKAFYQDFWEEKNGDIDQIKKNTLKCSDNLTTVQDFVSQLFTIPQVYEFLESIDIEWENNIIVLKKIFSNEDFLNVLNKDENFESYNQFYLDLVNNTLDHLDSINEKIKTHALNWDFERISLLDKAILSLAIGEFFYVNHLPKQIIINEYLEISKKISRIDSSIFINGILDKVLI